MNALFVPWRRNRKRAPRHFGAKGFTLIELAIVMGVMGIMAAFATPRVAQYMRNVNLRSAVQQLTGDLHIVKTQAIRGQLACAMNFDTVNQQYTLGNPINRTISLADYGGGVVFTANPGSLVEPFTPMIRFTPRGMSDSIIVNQVYITNQDGRVFRIQVTPTGAITIRRYVPAADDWTS